MRENGKKDRLSLFLLLGSIVVAIVGLMITRDQTYSDIGQLCPSVPVEYITVYAYRSSGEETNGVTRDSGEIQEFFDLCRATPLQNRRESYVGISYEDTFYTIKMGENKNTYSFSLTNQGEVYHAKGKYLMAEDGAPLYEWLEAHCKTEN